MVSDKPTVADVYAFCVMANVEKGKENIFDDFPALKKWRADFSSLDEVKAYMAM